MFFLILLPWEKFVLADVSDSAGSGAPPAQPSGRHPGHAAERRRSGIHARTSFGSAPEWIPGLRFASPGMTRVKMAKTERNVCALNGNPAISGGCAHCAGGDGAAAADMAGPEGVVAVDQDARRMGAARRAFGAGEIDDV